MTVPPTRAAICVMCPSICASSVDCFPDERHTEERDHRKHHDRRNGQHRPAAAEPSAVAGSVAAAFSVSLLAITAILREMP